MKYKLKMEIVNDDEEIIESAVSIVADDAEDYFHFENAEMEFYALERHLKKHIEGRKTDAELLAKDTAREEDLEDNETNQNEK